jgi:hypothetical protein
MLTTTIIPANTRKTAYLFLTDKVSGEILNSFSDIRSSVASPDRAIVLFHQKGVIPDRIKELEPYFFTYRSLLALKYLPIVMGIIPGSNHFPVLQYFLEFPGYDYYWVIEDDVRFTGEWKYFFDFFNAYEDDFISSHLRTFSNEPEWIWWRSLSHTYQMIPDSKRIRSFNPIYRISSRALRYIHYALSEKWKGHHEVLLPTLLYHNCYKIMDFGGCGDFVANGNCNMFYTSSGSDPKGLLREGTMRFRPVYKAPGNEKNKLYHPVKVETADLLLHHGTLKS